MTLKSLPPVYFNILSVGQTATQWFVSALSRHPEVVVGHAAELLHTAINRNVPRRNSGLGPDRHEANRTAHLLSNYTIDQLYAVLEARYSGKAYGLIHLFQTTSYLASVAKNRPARGLRLFNMVRHPVNRHNSIFHHWLKTAAAGNEYFLSVIDEVFGNPHTQASFAKEQQAYGLHATDLPTRCWYACLGYVEYFARDLRDFPGTRRDVIEMERLVTDADYFRMVMRRCVGPSLVIDADFVEQALKAAPLNSHSGGRLTSPDQILASWTPWQRDSFLRHADSFAIGEVYRDIYPDVASLCSRGLSLWSQSSPEAKKAGGGKSVLAGLAAICRAMLLAIAAITDCVSVERNSRNASWATRLSRNNPPSL